MEMKDYSIYVRIWDQSNWNLSKKYEFVVNKNTSMRSLSILIY